MKECPKCGLKNFNFQKSCSFCSTTVTDVKPTGSQSKLFKVISRAVLIIGGIVGFIVGDENIDILNNIRADYPKLYFNCFYLDASIFVWLTSIGIALLFWAIYRHLYNQEEIIKELKGVTDKDNKEGT